MHKARGSVDPSENGPKATLRLLLKMQPTTGAEPLFLKGRITNVVSDALIFGNPSFSVAVGFNRVNFDYEELPK